MTEHILYGPEKSNVDIRTDISVGKVLFDTLKSRPKDMISMVDMSSNEVLTYGQILEQSVQLAVGLQKLGVGKDDVVIIMSENSLSYCIPILASFYIGAIINPLNPIYTTRELKNAFEIAKPKIAFVSENNLIKVLALQEELTYLQEVIDFSSSSSKALKYSDVLKMGMDDADEFQPQDFDTKEQVACILCSSGTTGFPKGVMLTHYNFNAAFEYIMDPELFDVSSTEVSIGVVPFYHALGLILCGSSILTGMKLVVIPKFKPDIYLKAIEEHKVTILFLVPPLALFLAKSPLVDNYDLTSLRDAICGAAPLGNEIQNILEERLNLKLRQVYGMTETGGAVTLSPKNSDKIGSSGKLIFKIACKVLDVETNEPVGPNKVGEMCLRSPLIMKGYMGNEKATKDSFDEDGFFHTGDICYYDEEGYFYIVDRLKELIKYKGFQVAPAELEDILISHPNIKEAAVVGIPDERAGELPIAFVVKVPGANITEDEVRAYVAEQVSVQKHLHGGVRFIEAVPKTESGKILKRVLRDMIQSKSLSL